jgi:hypothetical protein
MKPPIDSRNENPDIPMTSQICKCGHTLDRHVRMRQKLVCIDSFCPCNNFIMDQIK